METLDHDGGPVVTSTPDLVRRLAEAIDGPTRRKALMRHFKDIEAIKEASIESLTATPGMNGKSAKSVYDFFH